MQAPGVPGSRGGVLAATVEAEVGRGRRAPVQEVVEEEEPIILDDLFRKTDAKPSLYWLPLSEEEVRGSARDPVLGGLCEGGDEKGCRNVLFFFCESLIGISRAANLARPHVLKAAEKALWDRSYMQSVKRCKTI